LTLDPDLTDVRLRLADMYLEQSSPVEALPHLERLRKQFPDRADVMAALGRCKFLQGQPDEARPLLEAAVEQLPDDTPLLVHLAKLDLLAEPPRAVEAEKWLRHSLTVDPYDLEAEHTLAGSLRLQGRLKEAAEVQERHDKNRELLRQADALLRNEVAHPSSGPKGPWEIGTLFLRLGKDGQGLDWLYRALQRDPDYRPAHEALAAYYEKKGERDKAVAHRRRLAEP